MRGWVALTRFLDSGFWLPARDLFGTPSWVTQPRGRRRRTLRGRRAGSIVEPGPQLGAELEQPASERSGQPGAELGMRS
jgi:hypothetical protein